MKKLLIVLSCVAFTVSAAAQGTIQFLNSGLSKIKYFCPEMGVVDAPVGAVVGVYWGTTADRLTLQENTVTVHAPGIFNGGSVYALPGTNPGETVFMQIAGWYNANGATPRVPFGAGPITDFGASDVIQTTMLGPTMGPGTVVWQSSAGTNPNRMKPFEIGNLTRCVPETTVLPLVAAGLGILVLRRKF